MKREGWHAQCHRRANTSPMKTILQLISLLTVSGYAAAQVAAASGFQVPASVNVSNAVIVLTVGFVALLLMADYGKVAQCSPAAVRVAHTNTAHSGPAIARARRSAYSIRRGAEAARLASPSTVASFPAAPRMRCDRAA